MAKPVSNSFAGTMGKVLVASAEKLLATWRALRKGVLMTREQVVSAAASGIPFTLRMADGRKYSVPHRDYISIPPKGSYVIVYDDHGRRFNVLPLLTMTGLESDDLCAR
jgi:hypothetical protein